MRFFSRSIAFLFSISFGLALQAQPVPKVTSASVEYIQRGTTSDITFNGENLGGVTTFLLSGDPGVTIQLAETNAPPVKIESSQGGISSIALNDDKKLRARISIESGAAISSREIRAVSPFGISEPVTLNVGPFPEINDNGDNKSIEKAQSITLPVTISGVISAASETDYYRFKGKSGEHIIFEVYGSRLGSSLDSSLAILDSTGKELARNEDEKGLDSLIDFSVPQDGEYLVQLRDFRYEGGGDFRYRLIAGALPYVASVFPLGGTRGTTVSVDVKGQNLDGISKITLNIAKETPTGRQDIRTVTPKGISNAFPFDISDLPEFNEKEPNTSLGQADTVSFPGIVNGRIQSPKDYDAFKFTAQKDQRLVFDVMAGRFGSPLDSLLTLTDDMGKVLQKNDDASGADARIDYTFKEAGQYYLIIEDLLERGGDNYAYRISGRTPQPSFSISFLPDNPRIHREGHTPIRCEVSRVAGFSGPVRIAFADLPSGLFSEPIVLSESGPSSGLLSIAAAGNAMLGTFPLKLVATGVVNGKSISKKAEALSGDKRVKGAFITVLEQAPFGIEPGTLMASVEQDATASIDVFLQRKDGFKGEVKVSAEGFSAGREPITKSFDMAAVTLPPASSEGSLKLKAKLDAETGTRPIVLKAEATVNGQTVTEYSAPLPLGASEVPFVLSTSLTKFSVTAMPPGSQSAASEAVFTVKADRRGGFTNEIALSLEGLPEGMTATVEKIPPGGKEATLKLVATDKTPIGKDFTLKITGVGTFNDRNYRQRPSPLTLTINAPEGTEVKTAGVK